ncbi:MAG: FAD-binding protein [Planctomycetes bacterium]|nr:FAD-binding protein [Planctomycetota bacterium]
MLSRALLGELTKVEMPPIPAAGVVPEGLNIGGESLPCYRCGTLVVGSGAAGLRTAVELKRLGEDVLVISTSAYGGTSACSGSDKQTLYSAGSSGKGDDYLAMARDIGSGGCMDMDTAYIEAAGSLEAMDTLLYLGLPLPRDRYGAVLRYRTDHDEVGRATSCGPRTSRLMVKVLAEEAIRLGVRIMNRTEAVQLLHAAGAGGERICGVVAIRVDQAELPHGGLTVFYCENVVLATGGPGELFRDSVYPRFCFGSLGMALQAGIECANLTEFQFGIGTRRTEFPWNLSGTYVQVLPRIYSKDAQGREYNFLADYYRTTQELASNVFRKVYQWPFHASRMSGFGSSLVDLAIFRESRKGRTVLMDFLRNPEAVPGDLPFSLERLDDEVRDYLRNNGALQALPVQRLKHMNPLAIELYRMHGVDLERESLPFNVSNQHMNGGIAVDVWNRTSILGCYAVGEVCGTHGVTRPGGSALNAGQVGGMRAARHIHAQLGVEIDFSQAEAQIAALLEHVKDALAGKGELDASALRDEIQARMSDKAGFICIKAELRPALEAAEALYSAIVSRGIACGDRQRLRDVFRWEQMALVSQAVLAALVHYTDRGGGSRGARALLGEEGKVKVETSREELGDFKVIEERVQDRERKLVVSLRGGKICIEERGLRALDNLGQIFFEKNWPDYLSGAIYGEDYHHG